MSHKKSQLAHPDLLKQIRRANNINWNDVVPLSISYGLGSSLQATGFVVREFARELVKNNLLVCKENGELALNLLEDNPCKKAVEIQIRRIETYCVERGHITELRGERLYLGDDLDTAHRADYASYDRNLDVLGFMVHSVCVITHQALGKQKGHIVVAQRHPLIISTKKDSNWDVLSGAIAYGDTPLTTRISEGEDEFGLSDRQMRRSKPITTITTHRTRENPYSLVREKMQVSSLGLSEREIAELECRDTKIVKTIDNRGSKVSLAVQTNVGFKTVSPAKILRVLRARKHLKNGKALAMMAHLMNAGHIHESDPLHSEIHEGLALKPQHLPRSQRVANTTLRRPNGTAKAEPKGLGL